MGLLSLVVIAKRWYRAGPVVAAGTVVLLLSAWGAAQYPYLVMPSTRIADVAADKGTLEAFLIALPIGALILAPRCCFSFLCS